MKFILNSVLNIFYVAITVIIILASYIGSVRNYIWLDSLNINEYLLTSLMGLYLVFIILVLPLFLRFLFRKLLEKIFKVKLQDFESGVINKIINSIGHFS